MLVGEVRSATEPWAKENPVIAPAVLRLTNAVACCHRAFFVACTRTTSSRSGSLRRGPGPGPRYADGPNRLLRMAWTCELPGSWAFWYNMLASCAKIGDAPTNHCW